MCVCVCACVRLRVCLFCALLLSTLELAKLRPRPAVRGPLSARAAPTIAIMSWDPIENKFVHVVLMLQRKPLAALQIAEDYWVAWYKGIRG